ncbi:hypothetical protein BDF20DRAFT_852824 [Mycotypha africana]|uniref:uncharacterized protein n=1 Tax=Mycotypha africana TaxID=64632 RepID=UPI002301AEAD|nr:uncharacterized protein BDF20DRAFT_852824 [Mycotypha africana]KAI8987914.1 hypothetical protein BDF20DRAFT_852824 [Mycotypha africana]
MYLYHFLRVQYGWKHCLDKATEVTMQVAIVCSNVPMRTLIKKNSVVPHEWQLHMTHFLGMDEKVNAQCGLHNDRGICPCVLFLIVDKRDQASLSSEIINSFVLFPFIHSFLVLMLINKHSFFFFLAATRFLSSVTCQQQQDTDTSTFDQRVDRYDFKTTITADMHDGFTIEYKNYYKIVTNTITSKVYCLVGFDQSTPEECASFTSVSIPVQNISVETDTYAVIPFLELLDLRNTIIKTDTTNITSPCMVDSSHSLDTTATTVPDMVFSQQDVYGAKYVSFSGHDDRLSPLQKASWLMYVAAFFDVEVKAYSIYHQLANNYHCHRDNVLGLMQSTDKAAVPVAWTDYAPSRSVYTVHSDAYYQQLVQDAGGRLVATNAAQDDTFNAKETRDRLGLAIALRGAEVIVDQSAVRVDYSAWVAGNAEFFSQSDRPPIQTIAAITNKQVYTVHRLQKNGNSDWYQRSHARPDVALLDMIHWLHPEYVIETTQTFPVWITGFEGRTAVTEKDEGSCHNRMMASVAFDQSRCTIQSNANRRTMVRKAGSSVSAKAGISVGSIVFGFFCIVVGIWLFRRYRRRQKRHAFYQMHEF